MRQFWIFFVVVGLLFGSGVMIHAANLTLKAMVGFDGYYRVRTVVPVAVEVENTGNTLEGEFRVIDPVDRALPNDCVTQVTIPRSGKQLYTLYIIPQQFARDFTVEFWCRGKRLASATYTPCKEVSGSDRLMVVVGSSTAFSFVNGQQITAAEHPLPRPWDFDGLQMWTRDIASATATPPGSPTGNVRVAYMDSMLLPENPEAYGSISLLALSAGVTENSLKSGLEAIPIWAASGGHVLIAGGGVPARLAAPFFTRLQPMAPTERLANADGGTALTGRFGSGRVTCLQYDPESSGNSPHWQSISAFYGKLTAREPNQPFALSLHEALQQASAPKNLRPPDIKVIVIFLLSYLILLVPVNYLVLKKLDKREFAWITNLAIVALFTFGAYGIGYLTKGHRLIINAVSVVETTTRQTSAEAVSQLLIFSPSRTSYRLNLGEHGLLAQPITPMAGLAPGEPQAAAGSGLSLTTTRDDLRVDGVRVNMWDARSLSLAHRIDMGKGVTANLQTTKGTVTNNTPYRFCFCALFYEGRQISTFSLDRGKTVAIDTAMAPAKLSLNEDEQHMLDQLKEQLNQSGSAPGPIGKGFVLVAFTTDLHLPIRVDNRPPTTAMTVMAIHL